MGTPRKLRSRARESKADRLAVVSCLLVFGVAGCTGTSDLETGAKKETRGGDCAACHVDEWAETVIPDHTQFGFSQTCGDCHKTEESWSPASGYPHIQTFPLTQGHANRACLSCHARGFTRADVVNDCAACHAPRAAAVASPVHSGLSQNCFACHKTDVFKPSSFVHSWPLLGVHEKTPCVSCHIGNPALYEGTSTLCLSCHADDRARADMTVSGHAAFGSGCQTCHNFATFKIP
jgi:predicted CXXCH cytochrome family protein